MSIRIALIIAMLATGSLATVAVGGIGVWTIIEAVRDAEQKMVNRGLITARTQYKRQVRELSRRLDETVRLVNFSNSDVPVQLNRARAAYDLDVLNVCGSSGEPRFGTYLDNRWTIPIHTDPVIRRALSGRSTFGTVKLTSERLTQEGGPALAQSVVIEGKRAYKTSSVKDALFAWAAKPIRDISGRVVAVLYGGRALNLNFRLVDGLRELVFGNESYHGKPLGTVTFFMDDIRIATNVRGPARERAIGTRVSDEVRRQVLDLGKQWHARAMVVDTRYFSAYEPLRDPDGQILGLLYVGLLEAPYRDMTRKLIVQLLMVLGVVALLAVPAAVFLVTRIAAPINALAATARRMAQGDLEGRTAVPSTYVELNELASSFREMQDAIAERDRNLQRRNSELATTNAQLARVNSNYMATLGFVTHELKSPLAAIQTMIDSAIPVYRQQVPEQVATFMGRIKRALEELQDMVKNYLDLSRAERGELEAHPSEIDLRVDVIDTCLTQVDSLFRTREVTLQVDAPDHLELFADSELLRIALVNYLSNAAKYGQEGGSARLSVDVKDENVIVSVWNKGEGFTSEERDQLFEKFSRLNNANTRSKRGSGLGLFLVRQIAALHRGSAWAESEPGQWARFNLSLPRRGVNG
jgi:two-component system NtrC family sensor kinase